MWLLISLDAAEVMETMPVIPNAPAQIAACRMVVLPTSGYRATLAGGRLATPLWPAASTRDHVLRITFARPWVETENVPRNEFGRRQMAACCQLHPTYRSLRAADPPSNTNDRIRARPGEVSGQIIAGVACARSQPGLQPSRFNASGLTLRRRRV